MTVQEALDRAIDHLFKHGVIDARSEAEFLLTHLLRCKRHALLINLGRFLTLEEEKTLAEYLKRRSAKEPSQHIVGETEFRGLKFKVTRDVLVPRPETELLVDEALEASRNFKGNLLIIDICTGSGCIAVSVAKELDRSAVFATDISSAALKVAEDNARLNGVASRVEFFEGDIFRPLEKRGLYGRAHMVLSNPPYVSKADMANLEPEVRDYEPFVALYGGDDGLFYYRRIISEAPEYLAMGGYLIIELGWGLAGRVKELVEASGLFEGIYIRKDYSDIERVLKARFNGKD